jgi:hypothetical protein
LILGRGQRRSIVNISGTILKHLDIIPGRLYFDLVENGGIYSVYHYCDGSYGQKNFGTYRNQAEQHVDSQEMCADYYKELIGKRDSLLRRISPLSNKLAMVNSQIGAGILR